MFVKIEMLTKQVFCKNYIKFWVSNSPQALNIRNQNCCQNFGIPWQHSEYLKLPKIRKFGGHKKDRSNEQKYFQIYRKRPDNTTSPTTTTTTSTTTSTTNSIEPCDEKGAYDMLDGPGKLTCETKIRKNKKGFRKICTVLCVDGQTQKGPTTTRCKNYNNKQGMAYLYWHTNKKHTKINCN